MPAKSSRLRTSRRAAAHRAGVDGGLPVMVVSLAELPEYGPRAKFNANAGCHAKGDSGSLDLTPMTTPSGLRLAWVNPL